MENICDYFGIQMSIVIEAFSMLKTIFIFVLISILGGAVRYLVLITKKEKEFYWTLLFIHGVIGGFFGYLMIQPCIALELPEKWIGFVAGSCGYLGPKSIDFIVPILQKKLGIEEGKCKSCPDQGKKKD